MVSTMTLREKVKPVIIGIPDTELTNETRKLLQEHNPLGIILFARNIKKNDKGEQDKATLTQLISDVKEVLGENSIIAIDQEGGRVKRLTSPTFYDAPYAKKFGDLAGEQGLEIAVKECKKNYSDIGKELKEIGINLDFAPVADLRYENAHEVIGGRSFGSEPEIVVPLCLAALEGLQQEGVQGCIKHLPGHGRAKVDSHKELPKVKASLEELEKTDFKVFKELSAFEQVKLAMMAHIIYEAIDSDNPATLSPKVIDYIRNEIGFKERLIITDAIEMKALSGEMKDIAQKTLEAGVNIVLECTGDYETTIGVLGNVEEVSMGKFADLFIS